MPDPATWWSSQGAIPGRSPGDVVAGRSRGNEVLDAVASPGCLLRRRRCHEFGSEEARQFDAQSDYGDDQDWKADPEGVGVLDQASPARRPDLHAWLRDRRQVSEAIFDCYSEPIEVAHGQGYISRLAESYGPDARAILDRNRGAEEAYPEAEARTQEQEVEVEQEIALPLGKENSDGQRYVSRLEKRFGSDAQRIADRSRRAVEEYREASPVTQDQEAGVTEEARPSEVAPEQAAVDAFNFGHRELFQRGLEEALLAFLYFSLDLRGRFLTGSEITKSSCKSPTSLLHSSAVASRECFSAFLCLEELASESEGCDFFFGTGQTLLEIRDDGS
jgi:hypothetical protein